MRLARLAGQPATPAALACCRGLPEDAPEDYRQLAALLVDDWQRRNVACVGIGGGQGAGKSTLAALLVRAGERLGRRVLTLSLDDFYLTRAERSRLAEAVHPLFATRGPPGTHDVARLLEVVRALKGGATTSVAVPRFDKGADDRAGQVRVQGPVDTIVVEGWCIGAPASEPGEPDGPINILERDEDADSGWRNHIDEALAGPYAALHQEFEELIFLAVPDLEAVRRWRSEQEQERPPAQRMTAAALARFIAHYERITRRMTAHLPGQSDIVVDLDASHRIAGLRWGK